MCYVVFRANHHNKLQEKTNHVEIIETDGYNTHLLRILLNYPSDSIVSMFRNTEDITTQ